MFEGVGLSLDSISRSSLLSLVQNSPAALALFTRDWRLAFVSQGIERILKESPESLLGRSLLELVHPQDVEEARARCRKCLDSPSQPVVAELRWRRGDGTWRDLGCVFVNELADREVQAVVASLRDISERKRAEAAIERSRERLRALSRRLMVAQEAERRKLARELHDEIGQALTAVKINIQAAQRVNGDPVTEARLEDCTRIIERTIQQVRDICLDLRPPLLDELGLVAAVRAQVMAQARRAGFLFHLRSELSGKRPSPDVEIACYRIAQEALNNVVRHAEARNVTVELVGEEGELRLAVTDDGAGFEPARARERAAQGASLGILGMEERAQLAGGKLRITSAPGAGTEVRATFPLGGAA